MDKGEKSFESRQIIITVQTLSSSPTTLLDAVMSTFVRSLSKPWTPACSWTGRMLQDSHQSFSKPWFSDVTMSLKFMTSPVVLHPSECDSIIPDDYEGTPTGSHCD